MGLALRHWLGLPVIPQERECPHCASQTRIHNPLARLCDTLGMHAHCCTQFQGAKDDRHNAVAKVLFLFLSDFGLRPKWEAQGLLVNGPGEKRPDLECVDPLDPTLRVLIDIQITSPCSTSLFQVASSKPLQACILLSKQRRPSTGSMTDTSARATSWCPSSWKSTARGAKRRSVLHPHWRPKLLV